MDDRLAGSGHPTGTMHEGVLGKSLGGGFHGSLEPLGSGGITGGNVSYNLIELVERAFAPDDVQHAFRRAFLIVSLI